MTHIQNIARYSYNNCKKVFIAILLFCVVCFSGLANVNLSTDYKIYFTEDNPERIKNEQIESDYTRADNVFIAVKPPNENVFSAEGLKLIHEITELAWESPYVTRVDSLTNFQYSKIDADDLLVGELYGENTVHENLSLAEIREIAISEPRLLNNLVSRDARYAGINLNFRLPGADPIKETPLVMEFVRQIEKQFEQTYPGLEVMMTGELPMNNAFSEASAKDLTTLFALSIVLMFLALMFITKSPKLSFVIFSTIIISTVCAIGLFGFSKIPLSPPSAAAPNILLAIVIASMVHVVVSFKRFLQSGCLDTQ